MARFLVLFVLLGACAAGQAQQPATPAAEAKRVGKDGVVAPVVLFAPEPEYSEEARKDHISGNVLVYLQVGLDGLPTHVKVLHGLGHGLDEQAVAAVSGYRFKPATQNGTPVRVEMNVQVNFQIFAKKRHWPF